MWARMMMMILTIYLSLLLAFAFPHTGCKNIKKKEMADTKVSVLLDNDNLL